MGERGAHGVDTLEDIGDIPTMGTPTIGPALGNTDYRTLSGEPIKPLYTAADLPDLERIGVPGQYPYTRGVYESMYRGRLSTMRQFAGFGTAEETNERFRYLLDHGP